jgi:uncharacterized protein
MSHPLLVVARDSIYAAVRSEPYAADLDGMPPELCALGKSFVTLTKHGRLRGCIGSLEAREPLLSDVAVNARKASRDPRFSPVVGAEVEELEIEVSILEEPEVIPARDYDHLVQMVNRRRDGLVVRAGESRAVFLPAVWEDLSEAESFVSALWRKAGLVSRSWPAHIRLERFTTRTLGPRHISKI